MLILFLFLAIKQKMFRKFTF